MKEPELGIIKKFPYDPAFDAIQMPPRMGLAFEGVAIAMDDNEATITIRYKRTAGSEVES